MTRALGIPQLAVPDPSMLQVVEDALRFVLAEGFGTGNTAFNFARAIPGLRQLGVPIVTGFVGDSMLGGTHINWARDPESGRISFDALFRSLNQYGLEPETLRSLLRPAFREDCVEQEVAGLRRLYEDLPGHDFQQAWRFDLMHRQRLKIASVAWLLSFGSWPVMPFAQKRLHRLAARLPLELFENRRLQRTILAQYFPKLAGLPVDGAHYGTLPIVPGPLDGIASSLRARRYRLTKRWTGREPRYYTRIYDFDGDGFRAIRRRAATALDVLDEVFEPDALRRILPEPDEARTYADAFAGPGAFRSILGLALLMERTGLAPR